MGYIDSEFGEPNYFVRAVILGSVGYILYLALRGAGLV